MCNRINWLYKIKEKNTDNRKRKRYPKDGSNTSENYFMMIKKEKPITHKNMKRPKILRSKIRSALDDFSIMIAEVINELYISGDMLETLSRSTFVTLPKKSGTHECELHWTISLLSHITEIMIRIPTNRTRSRIRPEIEQEWRGLVKDTGIKTMKFMISMISKRVIQMQKEVHLHFIDFAKTLDKK